MSLNELEEVVIVIPALNPDEKFINFLKELRRKGIKHILCVDDGSKESSKAIFERAKDEYSCVVLHHSVNLGQGRAYKTAFNYYLLESTGEGRYKDTIGIIQCDCDGQHHVEDILTCAGFLRAQQDKFVLGVRDFSDKTIPFRSRFGNHSTSLVFKLFCGMGIKDTQSGLKGIPKGLLPALMETPGERFEYASSCLLEMRELGVEILQFPIKTIYINGNASSHFNPLLDSARIYTLIFKYLLSSLSAFVVDIVAFSLFLWLFRGHNVSKYILLSTIFAKMISCTYTFAVNKKLVFAFRGGGGCTAVKFTVLCIVQALLSGFFTTDVVRWMHWNPVISKILVDTVLFFFSFQVQNRWVFKHVRKNK
jgi:dolichyl-phosphate beta-D-mannosyltransferase